MNMVQIPDLLLMHPWMNPWTDPVPDGVPEPWVDDSVPVTVFFMAGKWIRSFHL
jgi:hypothetical protein